MKGGVSYAFDCIGLKHTIEQCFRMLATGGCATLVGVMAPGVNIEVSGKDLLRLRRLQGSVMGSNRLPEDIPRLVEFYMQGRLPLDELISSRLPPSRINEGFEAMKGGGVGRSVVVFYDYDEIEYMTDCTFRHIPESPNTEFEMSGEPWYPVAKNDVFPEEFGTFLLYSPQTREMFMRYHADLLSAGFWQQAQANIRAGKFDDFFPYPEAVRFCNAFERGGRGAAQVVFQEVSAPRLGVDVRAAVEME